MASHVAACRRTSRQIDAGSHNAVRGKSNRIQHKMNVILLRVGIDTGSGGIAGPIFRDRRFEFVPIDADRPHTRRRTYGSLSGRHNRKLIEYFPERKQAKMRDCPVHDDPEFVTYTYGDPTRPKQGLRDLQAGDLLVFYAGLGGWPEECACPAALYIVGYFEVSSAGLYPDLVAGHSEKWIRTVFGNNWHILHDDVKGRKYKRGRKSELVLVKGGPGSRLLKKAVQLSSPRKKPDRGDRPVFVLDAKLEKYFGRFTTLNAIQRSIPRKIKPEFVARAARFVRSLK